MAIPLCHWIVATVGSLAFRFVASVFLLDTPAATSLNIVASEVRDSGMNRQAKD